MRGAWIEIILTFAGLDALQSLPVRGAWIEISPALCKHFEVRRSLPVRGAWIEMLTPINVRCGNYVAPRAGSVD